jgi:2'-5' RNA ligase
MLAIVPPEPERTTLRALQQTYSQQVDSVKGLQFPPHITLVHPCAVRDLDAVRDTVAEVCASVAPLAIALPTIGYFRHHPTLYYTVANNPALQALHAALLEAMADVRDETYKAYYRQPEGRAGELMRTYGSEYVLERYFPHLSLTRHDADREKFRALVRDLPMGKPMGFAAANVTLLVFENNTWVEYASVPLGG